MKKHDKRGHDRKAKKRRKFKHVAGKVTAQQHPGHDKHQMESHPDDGQANSPVAPEPGVGLFTDPRALPCHRRHKSDGGEQIEEEGPCESVFHHLHHIQSTS